MDSELGEAAEEILGEYPNADVVNGATDGWYDSHPALSNGDGEYHGELVGYGASFINNELDHGPVTTLDAPSELFFDMRAEDIEDWPLIGFGYSDHFHQCEGEPELDGIPTEEWLVHEAGYHSLWDGHYECATDDDLKDSAYDDGVRIDSNACYEVEDSDLSSQFGNAKHGRIWTVHLFLEPGSGRPTIAPTDPWCRQSSDAVESCEEAFRPQGDCTSVCD